MVILLLVDQPVLDDSGGGVRIDGLLALNLDRHGLVLLQAGGEIGLFGGLGCLGEAECGDLADGIGVLDGSGLVCLELLEVELLDEVRCVSKRGVSTSDELTRLWVNNVAGDVYVARVLGRAHCRFKEYSARLTGEKQAPCHPRCKEYYGSSTRQAMYSHNDLTCPTRSSTRPP